MFIIPEQSFANQPELPPHLFPSFINSHTRAKNLRTLKKNQFAVEIAFSLPDQKKISPYQAAIVDTGASGGILITREHFQDWLPTHSEYLVEIMEKGRQSRRSVKTVGGPGWAMLYKGLVYLRPLQAHGAAPQKPLSNDGFIIGACYPKPKPTQGSLEETESHKSQSQDQAVDGFYLPLIGTQILAKAGLTLIVDYQRKTGALWKAPEALIFGKYLVQNKHITSDQLEKALVQQFIQFNGDLTNFELKNAAYLLHQILNLHPTHAHIGKPIREMISQCELLQRLTIPSLNTVQLGQLLSEKFSIPQQDLDHWANEFQIACR